MVLLYIVELSLQQMEKTKRYALFSSSNVFSCSGLQVNIDFEPFKPINVSLYLCDNKFHTEVGFWCVRTSVLLLSLCLLWWIFSCGFLNPSMLTVLCRFFSNASIFTSWCLISRIWVILMFLSVLILAFVFPHCQALQELLESDQKFGFIVMDGQGCLYGTLSGNTRTVLHKFEVDLPKKHGRGGQSSLRFARLRIEKRHNYVRKVAEVTTQLFISNDRVSNTLVCLFPHFLPLLLSGFLFFDLCFSVLIPFLSSFLCLLVALTESLQPLFSCLLLN